MGDAKSIKERGILEQVIKSELDFITYVDVHTGTFHVIVTNDDTDVTPPPEGDYTQVNAQMIPLYVHPKDREACAAALELPHIQVGGQAVLGRQLTAATPWLTERHGYDPT